MYGDPPQVASASAALAVASTNTTIVAAPGAGFTIRLVGTQLSIGRTATGIADLVLTDGAGGAALVDGRGLSVAGLPEVPPDIPEPGISLTENTALVCNHIATIAAGSMRAIVYYFIDSTG